MRLRWLSVRDYRNIAHLELTLDEGVNVVSGGNAEGKTNFLESIWMLTGAKSFRTARDAELIRRGQTCARLDAVFYAEQREKKLSLEIDAEGRRISLGGAPFKRAAAFAGCFCCVCFSPDDLFLVSGAPAERRRFLDTALCQIYPSYLQNIRRLARQVAQRNALLKNAAYVGAALDLIESFDEEIAALTAAVTSVRSRYTAQLQEKARRYYETLSGGLEQADFRYGSTVFSDDDYSPQAALAALAAARGDDMRAGFSTIGCHRDELEIRLCGENGRCYSSQGQKRSLVLAMKLAEADIFESIVGEKPVLLLDDVLSELDENRQTFLIDCLGGSQAVITGCDETAIQSRIRARIFRIKGGRLP